MPIQPFRSKKGATPHAKLTADDVRKIRKLWNENKSADELAAMFKVNKTHIIRIVTYKTWFSVD